MKHLIGSINPDHGIKVATIYPDGQARVWDKKRENQESRQFLYSRAFSTYGKAKLWAAEFEESKRKMKMKEQPK